MDEDASTTNRAATEAAAAPIDERTAPPPSSTWLRVLVGVTTLLAIVSVFTVWTRSQMLDTDEWVDLSTELLEQEEIREALAAHLVDTLYEDGDLAAGVGDRLPPDFEGVAGLLAGALREPLTTGVERLLASDRLQARWESANRIAHETFVAIVRDETRPGLSTADGTVTLELRPMVVSIGERLGISDERLAEIPDDAGQVVVFESDELDSAQEAVRVLDFLSWFLFALILALYALAVFLATGRRRQMLSGGWKALLGRRF